MPTHPVLSILFQPFRGKNIPLMVKVYIFIIEITIGMHDHFKADRKEDEAVELAYKSVNSIVLK